LKHFNVFVFAGFTSGKYQDINLQLEDLLKEDKVSVVHTNMSGNRGVDFRFKVKDFHVLVAFPPKSSIDLQQALGRGARGFEATCTANIILAEGLFRFRADTNIMQYLLDKEKGRTQDEVAKGKLLR
jgi:hypothetical protein